MNQSLITNFPIRPFVDQLLDTVCVVNEDGYFVFVSAGCEKVFGYTQEEMIGRVMIDMVHPDDREKTLREAGKIMAGEHHIGFENRYLRKDGQTVHIQWSARRSDSGNLRIAVARDISQYKHVESRQKALYAISEAAHVLEDQLSLFQRIHQIIAELIPATHFAIAVHDENSGEIDFPYKVDESDPPPVLQGIDIAALCADIVRHGDTLLLTPDTDASSLPEALCHISGHPSFSWLGVPLKSHSGTIGALLVQNYSEHLRYTEQDCELLLFVSTQIAAAIERKQMLARLEQSALYDHLTQLPNRQLFYDRIKLALSKARREQGHLALLYLDLDRFKQVNDTLGHAAGDILLQKTAQRIVQCMREADTVARFGGDEFVILLENIDYPECAGIVADRISDVLSQPFQLMDREMSIVPSIGIAIFPQDGTDEQSLLQHADSAMYQAKRNGCDTFQRSAG